MSGINISFEIEEDDVIIKSTIDNKDDEQIELALFAITMAEDRSLSKELIKIFTSQFTEKQNNTLLKPLMQAIINKNDSATLEDDDNKIVEPWDVL